MSGNKLLMRLIAALVVLSCVLTAGCATKVPVAVLPPQVPAPPAAPTERAKSAMTKPSLTERFDALLKELRESLETAKRP